MRFRSAVPSGLGLASEDAAIKQSVRAAGRRFEIGCLSPNSPWTPAASHAESGCHAGRSRSWRIGPGSWTWADDRRTRKPLRY